MKDDAVRIPRFVISALRGGSGKTVISLGLTAALKDSECSVAPFKKGPDYIDAGWLGLAAGRPCYNLDTFFCSPDQVSASFITRCLRSDIAVIEGNRGLFDGIDLEGNTSTAEIAKLLKAPVILCLDCTKTTRTMAAVVAGCVGFDPDVEIAGVILNRVAGPRHQQILTRSIEHHCGVPVLGAIPKLKKDPFPERHMGLVPTPEHDWAVHAIDDARTIIRDHVDVARIRQLAESAAPLFPVTGIPAFSPEDSLSPSSGRPRIGVIRDAIFQFYYPDNIEALENCGAEIVYFSPLSDTHVPADLDAIYIGGGFPETHAPQIAANKTFRAGIRAAADAGVPIYAECGGLIFLGRSIHVEGETYPLCGVFPMDFNVSKKPQGHGYVVVEPDRENPWFPVGLEIRGHEFRYSKVTGWDGTDADMVFTMKRGVGIVNQRDGLVYKNVIATYTHLHALGCPSWAAAMVRNAAARRNLQAPA